MELIILNINPKLITIKMKNMKLFTVALYYGRATIVAENKANALEVLKNDDFLCGEVYGLNNKQIIFENDFYEVPEVTVQSKKEFIVNYYKE